MWNENLFSLDFLQNRLIVKLFSRLIQLILERIVVPRQIRNFSVEFHFLILKNFKEN